MNGLVIPVSVAVKRFRGALNFIQPMFEAISNSIEANATNITVKLSVDRRDIIPEGKLNKIDGFIVEDNGDGFNERNIKSFLTYMSEYKMHLGCKGIGRITWLKVFSHVTVESIVSNELVEFRFDENFDEDKIYHKKMSSEHNNKTTITFHNVKSEYYEPGRIDLRLDADVDQLRSLIEEHLMVKLSLLKINNKIFNININITDLEKAAPITNTTLIPLDEKEFSISDEDQTKYIFQLFYKIYHDKIKPKKSSYICAHGRTVKQIPEKVLSFSNLPDSMSSIFLLTSEYLDKHVNNERTDFDIPDKGKSLTCTLSWNDINIPLQHRVDEVLLEHFPNLKKDNQNIMDELVNEYPYLAKYIKKDNSKIKDKYKILKVARKEYEVDKEDTSRKFKSLLEENKIDCDIFYKTVEKIKDISARELAEYIVYRKQIITALSRMNANDEQRESLLHNLFMKMKTDSSKDNHAVYDNNLWLLDDKYMTYVYAASDKTIKSIVDAIEIKSQEMFNIKIRPDITIFYSNNDTNSEKDVVVIEFKGLGATLDEKSKSFWEINRNVQAIRQNIPNINRIWAYTITKFDLKFIDNIKSQDFKPLFSNNDKHGMYYRYFSAIDAHCYYISIEAILSDAEARNNIFLEIIKTAE